MPLTMPILYANNSTPLFSLCQEGIMTIYEKEIISDKVIHKAQTKSLYSLIWVCSQSYELDLAYLEHSPTRK